MSAEFRIAGDGSRLTLRLARWEFPDLTSGADANWIVGEAELTAGRMGRFSASHDVCVRSDALGRFRDELAAVLQALAGEASLADLEGQFGARINLKAGAGELTAFIAEHAGAELRVTGVRTDQSYLAETLRGLDAAVAAFGVRGRACD